MMEKVRRQNAHEPQELIGNRALAKEIVDGVVKLVGAGFGEHEVLMVWSFAKFRMMVRAVHRNEYYRRQDFVVDVAMGIAGILGGGKNKSPLNEHIKQLALHIREYLDG